MELKPCPFCHGKAHIDFSPDSNKPYINKDKELTATKMLYYVFCGHCLAKSMDFEDMDNAVEAWNRRAENG